MKYRFKNQYLKSFSIFLLTLILLDLSAGVLLNKLYSTSKSGVAFQENYIFTKTNEDVLIFGSSRASFHYKSDYLSNMLGMSVYNAGREGFGIYFHHALLLATLNRYKPKLVILDLDFRDIFDRGGSFSTNVFYEIAPFYNKYSPDFNDFIARNWYDPILFQSNLFKYNKKFFNIITSNIVNDNDFQNGYRPLKGNWDGKEKKLKDDNFELSNDLILTIESFIGILKENNVDLVVSISPTKKNIDPRFYEFLENLKNKHHVKILDYSRSIDFKDKKELFYDAEHLNENGAKLFTELFSKNINDFKN